MTGKKKLKRILLASLTLAATFSFASCGKKDGGSNAKPEEPTPGEVVGTKFIVTINIDGQTSTQEVNSGDIPTLTVPTKTGYDFEGWYTDSTFNTKYLNTAITADTTLYAHFVEATPEGPADPEVPESDGEIRTTVWNSAEVGTHTGNGSSTKSADGKSITVTGAGDKFDKDNGNDNLYYNYVNVKGNTTVIAKITPDTSNTAGFIGVMARNDIESTDMAAGVYYDYSKGQVRAGRHGGAATLSGIAVTDSIYVKLEFSTDACYYTVASDKDFTNILAARNGMGVPGLDPKTVGFIATEGATATFSDVEISYVAEEDGVEIKKVAFSSAYGEMSLTEKKSNTYYDGNEFSHDVSGNTLKVTHKRDAANKGNIREDKGFDYLVLGETDEDMSITCDIVIKSIDNGTDKQGFGIGQFSFKDGEATALSALHYQKNNVWQHSYTQATRGSGNSGNPETTGALELNQMFTVSYIKSQDKEYFKVVNASGQVLIEQSETNAFDLTQSTVNADIRSGKTVQYGLAFCGIECEISNIKLVNSKSQIVYDSNDYYIAKGVAPTVSNLVPTVADDRNSVELNWETNGGSGTIKYVVYASLNGGEYVKAGESKANTFTYTNLTTSGTYKFKVVPVGGSNEGTAIESADVNYVKPLEEAVLRSTNTDSQVVLSWDAVSTATSYEIYRALGTNGEYSKIATTSELTYTDTNVVAEEGYRYRIVAKNDTNSSNPSDYIVVVVSTGHTSSYVYEKDDANIIVVSKSDDTLFTNTGSLTLKSEVAGSVVLNINGTQVSTQDVEANTNFDLALTLLDGRNEVEVLLTDSNNKITRLVFNFVVNPSYDVKVDATFTGNDGDEVEGVKVYKTIKAAYDAAPSSSTTNYVIFIANGTYDERIEIKKPNISLLGQDAIKTKIAKSVCVAANTATVMWDRNVIYVDSTADGFTAENLTIENTYPYKAGNNEQCDALCIVADKTICVNLRLISFQDTLCLDSRVKVDGNYEKTRQYFEKCYITGNVDFIYGSGSAYFYDCDLVARYTESKADGCYTAARTYENIDYGFVFDSCRFTSEDDVADDKYRLARPWGADASTIFIDCYLGRVVEDAGYGDMSGNLASDARFGEFGSYGDGYVVRSDRPYLSSTEAQAAKDGVIAGFSYATVMTNLYKNS